MDPKLYADILDHPTDDEPRLIMADWLDDRSDPRGEFIRLQCEREALDWDEPRHWELTMREAALLAQHRAKWMKALPKIKGVTWGLLGEATAAAVWGNPRTCFRRGMPEYVTVADNAALNKGLAPLRKAAPVSHVGTLDTNTKVLGTLGKAPGLCGFELSHSPVIDWKAFAELPFLQTLETLGLHEATMENSDFERLMEFELPSLQRLDVGFSGLDLRTIDFLSWSELAHVRYLNLALSDIGVRNGEQDGTAVKTLAKASKKLKHLHVLDLSINYLTAESIELLVRSARFARLTELSLAFNEIGDDGVAALAKLKAPKLRTLVLSRCGFTADAVDHLAQSKVCKQLKQLNLGDNDIGDEGLRILAESKSFSGLTHLELHRCNIGQAGAEALLASETLTEMTYINLGEPCCDEPTRKALKKKYGAKVWKEAKYGY